MQAITEDKYEIIQSVGDAAIVIKNTKEPPLTLTIHLTSPVVREEMEKQSAGGTGAGEEPQPGLAVANAPRKRALQFRIGAPVVPVPNSLSQIRPRQVAVVVLTQPECLKLSSTFWVGFCSFWCCFYPLIYDL